MVVPPAVSGGSAGAGSDAIGNGDHIGRLLLGTVRGWHWFKWYVFFSS